MADKSYVELSCAYCKGTGKDEGEVCPACKGKAKLMVSDPPMKCQFCKGQGYMMRGQLCRVCKGTGYMGVRK